MSCLFCKIATGEIPSAAVYQDDLVYAFSDINPKAPVHVLVIPREHVSSLAEAVDEHRPLLGHLMWTAAEMVALPSASMNFAMRPTSTMM